MALLIVLVTCAVMVLSLLQSSRREKKREVAKETITNYLQGKGFTMVSFECIRKSMYGAYDDEFLSMLPHFFPTSLRLATLKGGKSGLAKLVEGNVQDEGSATAEA